MSHRVLLVGGGGWLGLQVLNALHAVEADVRVLLRHGNAHPKAGAIAALGAAVVAGDLGDASSLLPATEDVHTILSVVQGGPDIIVDGQLALAQAGVRNGAARIFTSDYSVRFDGVTEAEHLFLGWRARAREAIAATGLPQVHMLNGAFMEMLAQPFFGLIDWKAHAVTYWGDADQPYDFTHTGDVATYLAAAALDRDLEAGDLEIIGDVASPRTLAALAQEVTGMSFDLTRLGGLKDLDAEIARRQAASPADPSTWAGLQYHRLMANGAGRLHAPQNARFPGVQPRSVPSFLREHHHAINARKD